MIKRPHAGNTPLQIARFVVETQVRYSLNRKQPKRWGEWFRKELTMMGPAFIKMGQFLSTRADVFDKEIVSELAKLQDDITPTDISEIHGILNESLGRPWNDVFSDINPVPIACASIGQVHSATLRETGKHVVVKVQKPYVAQQIRADIETLKRLNNMLLQIGSSRAGEVENVLQQYERFLAAELDYKQEMYHMKRFRTILEDMPVRVPRVYNSLCTSEVLVMEYVQSSKINDVPLLKSKSVDTQAIAETLINIFLHMIITHGYVHCDPHPGNVGVAADGETIVLYDFGNVIELSEDFRQEVNNLIFAVYQKDVNEFVDILLKLKVFNVGVDDAVDIRGFFRSFFEYLETLDVRTLQDSIRNQEIFAVSAGAPDVSKLKVEPDFLALFRVFSLLDGTCSQLDPNFNYIDALAPFAQDMLYDINFFDFRARKDIQKVQNYSKSIASMEQTVVRTQRQLGQMNVRMKHMEFVIICGFATSLIFALLR
jgi:predicted unusual protein kinase regulating ubiquinone biosynthesis (AarF/ABC1/UbiB family)